MKLKGKAAIVTGSATGIGRAIALRLAKEGVNVTINFTKSEKEAEETKKEIEALGVKCLKFQGSVADDAKVREMVRQTVEQFGRLDILVNNAATTRFIDFSDLEGMKSEYWDEIMNVNVKGMFFCCRAAAEELKKQKGCIVNITSVAGVTGQGSSIAYAASKAAAISLTKSLARTLAPHVRVNSIAPGVVMTRWVAGHEEHVKRLAGGTPLGRAAVPEDVAEVAYALIAHSDFVTGQNVVVDGGMFI